ncbi:MAG: pilus assembly protein TadE [Propionibacteriaceae bacterium]|jgi:hypothetical protein|nr:pilus assembly protein TadE [Propionibacteriaceae bacterium]
MVTLEIAFGAVGIAAIVYLLVGVFAIIVTQLRCVDAAAEITRQMARGDQAAVAAISQDLPGQAHVSQQEIGDQVLARVEIEIRPWGRWLFPVTVSADAETRSESRVP